MKTLVHTLPSDFSDVNSISVTESYKATMSQAIIGCKKFDGSLGDNISFNIGFSGDSGSVFYGYVRGIETSLPDGTTRVTLEDELSKATEYFMASVDPQDPFSRTSILTEDLVEDILNEAQITNFNANVPLSVTWGTKGEVEFNLVTAWQAASSIVDALAWHMYAGRSSTVYLRNRPPYWVSGDSADFTWNLTTDNLLSVSYTRSTDKLRNRIVVYGQEGVSATASDTSPYLPGGFYKTGVIATQLIDSSTQAQAAADNNLALMNRLTESVMLEIEGDYEIAPRKFVVLTITDSEIGLALSGNWFIYQVEHSVDKSGYKCNVVLTR